MKQIICVISSLLSVFMLCSCGRELELTVPAKKPVVLNEKIDALTINTADFSSFATTFSMFFVPEENELTWESPLYLPGDKYATKVARIMNNIIRKSDEFDIYDQKILDLNVVKSKLATEYETLECDFEYVPRCAEIDKDLKKITDDANVTLKLEDGTEKQVDYEGYKSWLIEGIQSSVDFFDSKNPELNRPNNWMLYGDAPVYEIRPLEDGTVKITFPNLGPFGSQNSYSTDNGEIYDVKLVPSEWNRKVELLKFKIKEKNEKGEFTSFIWEYTLERSFVVKKLRYKGDILKVDSKGDIVRRGILKVDFAPKGS